MSNTIKNFLVGVGLETKDFDKGSEGVNTKMAGMATKAGIAGIAITAAFVGVGLATISAMNRVDDLSLKMEGLATDKDWAYHLGGAFNVFGGDASDALDTLRKFEDALANYRLTGDIGMFEDAAFAGIDIQDILNSKDGKEVMLKLAQEVPNMSIEQQNVLQQKLGLTNTAMRVLRSGTEGLNDSLVQAANDMGSIEDAMAASREYNAIMAQTTAKIEGLSNALAVGLGPALVGVLSKVNDFLNENKDGIVGGTTSWVDGVINGPAMTFFGDVLEGSVWGGVKKLGAARINSVADTMDNTWSGVSSYATDGFNDLRGSAISNRESYSAGWEMKHGANKTSSPEIKNNIDLNINIEGRALEHTITDVIDRRDQATMEDMQSTTAR